MMAKAKPQPDQTRLFESTRDCPPLSLRAAVAPDSIDPEKRTVEVVWTTGARVLRGFWETWYEELSLDPAHVRMDRLNNGAPLLNAHNAYDVGSVIGVVEGAKLEGGKRGVATVRFAKAEDDPQADAIFRKVKDGIVQNVSVGYRVYKLQTIEKEEGKIPVMRAVDWEPYEISAVPMGADEGAGFRGGENEKSNPCLIVRRLEHPMPDETKPITNQSPAKVTPETAVTTVLEATREAIEARERQVAESAVAASRQTQEAIRQEREREVGIRDAVRRGGLPDEFADRMIREGASLREVRDAVFDHLTTRSDATAQSSHVDIQIGEDERDKFVRGGCASIFQRAGTAVMIAEAKKLPAFEHQLRDVSLDPGEFGGMSLLDLARRSLERRGQSTRGLHGEALIKRALQYRDAGMNVAGDFAILLETAVNKTFLGQYAITPVTWRRWCGVKSVQDFRTSTFYRPGSFGALDAVTEAGEVKHKNIPDGEKSTLTPSTKGNIIGITRRAIVNDDMGVFRDLAGGLGMAAAYTIEGSAFALVLANSGLGPTMSDAQPLFHTNRSNIGATGAMSVTTWDSAAGVMAVQQDVSKKMILNLTPAVWLGPRTLQASALQLNRNTSDPTVNKSSGVANPVQGMVQDVVATGQLTGTRHYFFADPSLYPVFAVGFIDGQEQPRIDSHQSFEYDGVQWRIIMDYGVAVLDYRGSVTCAGA